VQTVIDEYLKKLEGADIFYDACLVSQIAGMLLTQRKLGHGAFANVWKFRDEPGKTATWNDGNPFQLLPQEAIEAYRASPGFNDKIFRSMLTEIAERSDYASEEMVKELKKKLQEKMLDATARGLTWQEFADWVQSEEAALGLSPTDDSYLRMAYRTNINTAYSSGHYDQVEAFAQERPYWQYLTAGDGRVRPEHAALDGAVFKFGDADTDRFMPPIDFNCRCDWVSLEAVPAGAQLYEAGNIPASFRAAINPEFEW
jgi:SPP1 gp7 family putative phage head morphogenesis protein